jgi:hypothetical protein
MQTLLQIGDQQREGELVFSRGLIREYPFGSNQKTAPFVMGRRVKIVASSLTVCPIPQNSAFDRCLHSRNCQES